MMLRSPGTGITIRSTTPPAGCIRRSMTTTTTMAARCCSLPSPSPDDKSKDSVSLTSRENHTPTPDRFNMSKIEFRLKNPSFIERTRNELADYCGTLDGDECYSCWDAYYQLRYLKKECTKEEVENLIAEAGSLKALVRSLHSMASLIKSLKQKKAATSKDAAPESSAKILDKSESTPKATATAAVDDHHIPDGIPEPGSTDEKEDEGGMLDDSPYMKMLRVIVRGHYPTHYDRPVDS